MGPRARLAPAAAARRRGALKHRASRRHRAPARSDIETLAEGMIGAVTDSRPTPPETAGEDAASSEARWLRAAAIAVLVAVAVLALERLAPILQPLALGLFLFYLGAPLARRLERWRVPPLVASLAVVLGATAALAVLGWIVTAQVPTLRERLPEYVREARELLTPAQAWLVDRLPRGGESASSLVDQLFGLLTPASRLLRDLLGGLLDWGVLALLAIVFLVFLHFEATTLPERLRAALGERRARRLVAFGARTNEAIVAYMWVKGAASLVIAVLSAAILLAFGVDFALLWAALVFFGNFIPYVGSFVAVLLPLGVAILQFRSWPAVLVLALLLIAAQVFVAELLEPRLAGKRLNLSPVLVIASLLFGGLVWGIVGMVLVIPYVVALRLAFENASSTRWLAILMADRPIACETDVEDPGEAG